MLRTPTTGATAPARPTRTRTMRALALAAGLLALARAGAPAPATLGERVAADSAAAAALYRAGRASEAHARLEASIGAARRAGDRRSLSRLLRIQGALYAGLGEAGPALPRLDEALRLAAALGDTAGQLRALRSKCYALGTVGRFDEQWRTAGRQIELARAARDTSFEALGRITRGWVLMQRGEFVSARTEVESGVLALRARRDDNGEGIGLTPLGSLHLALGDYPAARATYERQLELARRSGNAFSEAQALNELGVLERAVGDPARALELFERAQRSHESRGEWREVLQALQNHALALSVLGRHDDALRLLRNGVVLADREGYRGVRATLAVALGSVEHARGRARAAMRHWREAMSAGDTLPPRSRAIAVLNAGGWLAAHDSLAEAMALVERERAALRGGADAATLAALDVLLGQLLVRDGRSAEAAPRLRALARASAGRGEHAEAALAWVQCAQALRVLGDEPGVGEALSAAAESWERTRLATRDPEWREVTGAGVNDLAVAAVDHAWRSAGGGAGDRLAAAFDAAQRFKARTLVERFAGPAAFGATDSARFAARPVTLAELRASGLRPGELLLEMLVGPDSSWCFAVSLDTALVTRLPGRDSLRTLVDAAFEVASSPEATSAGAATGALRALGGAMYAGSATLLAHATVLLVAPDDVLNRVPFAALPTPGTDVPLGASVRVARVPGASLLALARGRRTREPHRGLLALAAGADSGQARLDGARREVEAIGGRYRGTRVRTSADSGAFAPDSLAGWTAVHLAGHTRLDDQRPWRSSLIVRDAAPGRPAIALTAEDVARTRLDARLVVLSGCESAGGRVLSGEGVAGLSSAFLAAGVPTVVATLWPVDDATASQLVGHFYQGLAAGLTAGEALATAQTALHNAGATRHPFHWAGWVLIGDPHTRLALRPRPLPLPPASLYLLAGLALAVGLVAASSIRRRRLANRV